MPCSAPETGLTSAKKMMAGQGSLSEMDAAIKAMQSPDVREKLVAQGFTVNATSPEELARFTREQLGRYATLFKQAGIRAD